MLEKMRAETRRRERLDGTWERRGAPGVERDWLESAVERESAVKTTPAPMDDGDYAEYIKCVRWMTATFSRGERAGRRATTDVSVGNSHLGDRYCARRDKASRGPRRLLDARASGGALGDKESDDTKVLGLSTTRSR